MVLHEQERRAEVYLDPDQVSLAIGKGGLNIKLASMLTEYTIDVYRDTDDAGIDDVNLDQFVDVVEDWIINEFKKAGFNTAREVLSASRDELVRCVDVEEETIDDVLQILAAEFENENVEDGGAQETESPEAAEPEENVAETTETENPETEEQ